MMTVTRANKNKCDYYEPDFFGGVLDSFIKNEVKRNVKQAVSVNVTEADDSFEIQFLLAGFAKEEVDINVEDQVLNVSGKKERSATEARYLRKEFSVDDFERAFTLPDTIKVDGINATFSNGILTIVLPKKEPVKPVTVKIDVK